MSITIEKQVRNFTDLDFLFTKHPITNTVAVKKNINAIRQSVINLLTLRDGDKPFHPEIASPIYFYLFENFSLVTEIVLDGEIRKYLKQYEPRIVVNDIKISMSSPNDIHFTIVGTIINTTEPFTVNVLINRLR